jgi:hypothetical protein
MARAAVLNKALARRNLWTTFLREKGYLKDVQNIMRKAAVEYRAGHLPSDKYKIAIAKRKQRLKKASSYLKPEITAQLPKKFEPADVDAVIADLKREIEAINALVPPEEQVKLVSAKG